MGIASSGDRAKKREDYEDLAKQTHASWERCACVRSLGCQRMFTTNFLGSKSVHDADSCSW